MPEKTCSTCQCNKVCDHNKYGFENCGNYISADLVPRSTIKEIFALIWDAFQSTYYDSEFEEKFDEIEKKYTED